MTTCWYLLQGNDLTIVGLTLPLYLPELVTVVKFSSRYRKRAAYLAAQGFLQRGLVALHHLHFAERVAYCQKAVEYASTSGDLTLLVTCLIHLSGAFRENGQLTDMLETYLQAERYSQQLSGFPRSRVQTKLSLAYAKQGRSQEVTRCLGEARRLFTEADDEIPVFLSADHSLLDIILNEGLSVLHLGNRAKDQGNLDDAQKYWKDAVEKFDKMEQLPSGLSVPVHIAAQIEIARTLAEALARNMEGFLTAFEKGAKLAKELGSEKRRQEAREALNAALGQWHNDQRITGLWELLV